MPDLLFVYGTLRPGIAPAAVADLVAGLRVIGEARAHGRLYNLGPYPGVILDAAAPTRVHGVLLELPSPPPWPRLDAYEGYDPLNPAASLYIRRRCDVELADRGRGIEAWVYEYNRPVPDSCLIPSGRYDRAMPRQRPVIGVTMDHEDQPSGPPGSSGYYKLAFDYCAAIEKAGGLPLAIPYRSDPALIPQFVDLLDGILFTGGNDLDPALYGQQWHPRAAKIDPQRQSFEMALLAEVERRRLPSLFVCLGCQLLNVYRGGSLTQFLPDEQGKLEHRRGESKMRRHDVKIEPDSALGRAIGAKEISANTYHKQAVNQLGRGLRIVAKAPDGVVEAMEDPAYPMMVAVQWHPERLADEREHLAPFRLLVQKAAKA
jgi:putative glutamine amidotransferase